MNLESWGVTTRRIGIRSQTSNYFIKIWKTKLTGKILKGGSNNRELLSTFHSWWNSWLLEKAVALSEEGADVLCLDLVKHLMHSFMKSDLKKLTQIGLDLISVTQIENCLKISKQKIITNGHIFIWGRDLPLNWWCWIWF